MKPLSQACLNYTSYSLRNTRDLSHTFTTLDTIIMAEQELYPIAVLIDELKYVVL